MIKNFKKTSLALGILILVAGCNNDDNKEAVTVSTSYDLGDTNEAWQHGFADYPVGGELDWELVGQANTEFSLTDDSTDKGYYLHSENHSDDTKMYIMRQVNGLAANTLYDVKVELSLASNINDQCFGIGGAPHAVTVKSAFTQQQPTVSVDEHQHYRLSIDVGNQTQEGIDGQALGHIGHEGLDDCDPASDIFKLKTLNNSERPFEVTSDNDGKVWVTLLTDSGFEGPTSIYFTDLTVEFEPSEKSKEGFESVIDFTKPQPLTDVVFFDYPINDNADWQLEHQAESIVTMIDGSEMAGYLLHSYNRSDDTGMLLSTPIKGLAANTQYSATFETTLLTNVNDQCVGIGGAPHAVSVKAAISLEEPKAMVVEGDDHYRINIDIGNNTSEGTQSILLGDIGSEYLDDCDPSSNVYDAKTFDSVELNKDVSFTTDENGIVYFSILTDSGFEGPSTILFNRASVKFSAIN